MKKNYYIKTSLSIKVCALFALTLTLVGCSSKKDTKIFDENGASKSLFSVSKVKRVRFSKGNLQYQPYTGIWRFAENQTDAVLEDNSDISPDYDGWIDLFGWGTSGWNSGAKAYMPYETNDDWTAYIPGNDTVANLSGEYANADWGVYNKISNGGNEPGIWRTLSYDEWDYLFNRNNGDLIQPVMIVENKLEEEILKNLRNKVSLEDTTKFWFDSKWFAYFWKYQAKWVKYQGFIIYPDIHNEVSNNDEIAILTVREWKKIERTGAIFLPVTGFRSSDRFCMNDWGYEGVRQTTYKFIGFIPIKVKFKMNSYGGYYWSSNSIPGYLLNSPSLNTDNIRNSNSSLWVDFQIGASRVEQSIHNRNYGMAVRLVMDE